MTIPRPSRHYDQGTSNSSIFWHFIVLVSTTSLHILNDDSICALGHLSSVTGGVRRSALWYCFDFGLCGLFVLLLCFAWGASSLACPDTLPFFLIRVPVTGVGLLSYHFSSLSCSFSRSEYHLFSAPLDFVFVSWVSFSPLRVTSVVLPISVAFLMETRRGWILTEFLSLFVWKVQVGEDEGAFPGY